jgi:Rps23 Pro-64 3,4-dihydroxylase Tpa1-like proline 4-hydroxylase
MNMADSKGPMPPFALLRDFLSEKQHAGLLEWALASATLLQPSTVGVERQVDPRTRLSQSLTISSEHQHWREILRSRLEEKQSELFSGAGVRPFPIAKVELELVVYLDGAHFRPHRDIDRSGDRSGLDRVLTGVYYFYAEPKGFTGGALRLIRFGCAESTPGDFVEIEPEQNSLLVFPSWAMHEVTPVRCAAAELRSARLAINCWLHRARRPSPDETRGGTSHAH